MEKNWLIRTKEHEIIGPVSEEKVLSLLNEGKLIDEDELCKGNSFWFFVKEKQLLKKFLGFEVKESSSEPIGQNMENFILESNSGEAKNLQNVEEETKKTNNTEDIKLSATSVDKALKNTLNDKEENNSELENKNEEKEEGLGEKFKLPDGKKHKDVGEVKKKIQVEIKKEIKKDKIISLAKKKLIYPVLILLLISSLLYLFYYVKFLGGKVPFISNVSATTVEDNFAVEKKKTKSVVIHQKNSLMYFS
jgi:hypothetical protein